MEEMRQKTPSTCVHSYVIWCMCFGKGNLETSHDAVAFSYYCAMMTKRRLHQQQQQLRVSKKNRCLSVKRPRAVAVIIIFLLALFRWPAYWSVTNLQHQIAINQAPTTVTTTTAIFNISRADTNNGDRITTSSNATLEKEAFVTTLPLQQTNDASFNNTNNNADQSKSSLPTKSTKIEDDNDDDDDDDTAALLMETPQVLYNDLKYRRVCAQVHSSILCLILRYPFEVPLQDPSVSFPKPFDRRLDGLRFLVMVDGPLLQACRNQSNDDTATNVTTTITTKNSTTSLPRSERMSSRIHHCLEQLAAQHRPGGTVVALWTRRRRRRRQQQQQQQKSQKDGGGTLVWTPEEFYVLGDDRQRQRTHDFFQNHVILVLGASTTSKITSCLTELFATKCQTIKTTGHDAYRCGVAPQPSSEQQQQPHQYSNNVTYSNISIRVHSYFPTYSFNESIPGTVRHIVNSTVSLMEMLRTTQIFETEQLAAADATKRNSLRPISVLVDLPMSHSQTQYIIDNMWDQVKYNQERLAEMIYNVTSPIVRQELKELGFQLSPHLIVFDGQPQFFPSETGGYLHELQVGSEDTFLKNGGYAGWRPELGSSCRSPLPRNSTLRHVNDFGRHAFEAVLGMDMKWYGHTWEFANLFWWQTAKWWKKGPDYFHLDCVHTKRLRTGLSCVNKYFLQAMIDDHYDLS